MLELKNINKRYHSSDEWVLKNFSFQLQPGEAVAITGESGRGKTTLINIIGLLDDDFEGEYNLLSKSCSTLCQSTTKKLSQVRNQYFGFVFQSALLIPHLSIIDNIGLPLYYRGLSTKMVKTQALGLLEQFNLAGLSHRLPRALSGGQKQRVSILRALIHQPKCIIADEPTSQLDMATQKHILDELFLYQKHNKCSMILVTHQPLVATRCDRVVDMI